ncbi:MAG: hypothetical protein LBS71_01145 [Puniceicoccales bacterium]|jgi:hypothetical protein|nr:hypothetical protein [Puniceicoccales bacterium]
MNKSYLLGVGVLMLGLQSNCFASVSFFQAAKNSNHLSPQESIEQICKVMALLRPHRPINGNHYQEERGILFNGKKFYFSNRAKEIQIILLLTKSTEDLTANRDEDSVFGLISHLTFTEEDLAIDVIEKLELTEEEFNDIEIQETDNYFHFLIIKGKKIQLCINEIILLVSKLGKVFGLSQEDIIEKFPQLFN